MARNLTPEEAELWNKVMSGTLQIRKPSPQPTPQTTPIKPKIPYPKKCVDLHGLTIQEAHAITLHQLDIWKNVAKSLVFITGKSGIIRQEFLHWVQNTGKVETLNGGGAFRVFLKKNK